MTSLLFRISLSAIFSIASMLVIVFRVSPLTSPQLALPFFFLTFFLSIASVGALAFYGIWVAVPLEGLDGGKKLTIALREGIFFSLASTFLVLFHLLGILTWWIALLIYGVFLLVEVAMHV